METEKERKAILAKLQLLEKVSNLHEWTVFAQKEAGDMEKTEAKIDSEASDSMTDQHEGEYRSK